MRRTAVLLCLTACTGEVTGFDTESDAGPEPDATAVSADASATPGELLGSYKLTYYYVTDEAAYDGPDDTGLYDPGCALLAMVPSAFARSLAIEGTGRLEDGRVVNYAGSCGCPTTPCYRFVDAAHPWGNGFGGRPLVPFRSVAIDRAVLVIGRRYYVEELDGVVMPGDGMVGGFVHDGCVSADDTGGGIDGQHIDFFSALRGWYLDLDEKIGLETIHLHEGGTRCGASPSP